MSNQLNQMKWILFWVFLALFVLMVLGTLATVFLGFGSPTESERALMVKGLIIEVAASIVALFYSVFRLNKSPEDLDELQNEKIQEISSSIENLNKKFNLFESRVDVQKISSNESLQETERIAYKSEVEIAPYKSETERILDGFEIAPPFSIEEFKLNPLAKEIYKDLSSTKPFDLKHREESYIGRKIQWKAIFKSISQKEKGSYKVVASVDVACMVIFEIDESTSHLFRNMDSNTPFWVCGEIYNLDALFVSIKNTRVETGR